jgi:hypothetical protein
MGAFVGIRAVNAILVEYLAQCQDMATVSKFSEQIRVTQEATRGLSEKKKRESDKSEKRNEGVLNRDAPP